jgi:phospholipid/cholesterol/gamma-HCH transport system permease protein
MLASITSRGVLTEMAGAARRWCVGGWRVVHLGAVLLVLAASPSSYTQASRRAVARHLVLGTAPALLWFMLLSALIGVVIIRIVVVTAAGYGLSQYALQMVVRVLVLELIPLTAAVFVALRIGLPGGRELARLRSSGALDALYRRGLDPLTLEVMPRVLAGAFAVLLLAAVSAVSTLLLAYFTVHGFTVGGFERYTRTVGQVFSPAVTLIFILKTSLLATAVSLIPAASALYDPPGEAAHDRGGLRALVRLFLALLLIEAASLIGNYY